MDRLIKATGEIKHATEDNLIETYDNLFVTKTNFRDDNTVEVQPNPGNRGLCIGSKLLF